MTTKSLLFAAGFVASITAFTHGQGTVAFKTYPQIASLFFDDEGVPLEGSAYMAQLYNWRRNAGFVPEGRPTPFLTDGYFNGGIVTISLGQTEVWVQVRAWKTDGGATFEQAASAGAWTGVSKSLFLPRTGFIGGPPTAPALLEGLEYPGRPWIIRQPRSTSIAEGDTAILSVVASSGVTMSYQWFHQPSDRPDGLIVGATNAVYTTQPIETTTRHWVEVSNSAGSTLSEKATLAVLGDAPVLTIQREKGLTLLRVETPIQGPYKLEFRPDWLRSNWTNLVNLILPGGSFTFTDKRNADTPSGFYRVVSLE